MSPSSSPPPAEPSGPRVLVVDTASRTEALALAHGDWVVSQLSCRTRKGHSAVLLPAIHRHLQRQGWSVTDLDAFAIVAGPGSFTGIRVGIATVLGLARAARRPVFGYGSLHVRSLALQGAASPVVPILDARKGEVYAAAYHEGEERIAPCAVAPEVLAPSLAATFPDGTVLACGGGARLYRSLFEDHLGSRFVVAAGSGDAPGVGAMALDVVQRLRRGEKPPAGGVDPIYLRPSQAETSAALTPSAGPT
jgi:tRNA threonylcarbamoyladenosine biosynthesis protein TsaB